MLEKIGNNYQRQREIMAYCPNPKCGKVVLRKGDIGLTEKDQFSYSTLCPHCKARLRVIFSKPIRVYLEESEKAVRS